MLGSMERPGLGLNPILWESTELSEDWHGAVRGQPVRNLGFRAASS